MCKSEDCLMGLKLVKFTKIPCDDFLVMGLRYQHVDPPSPDVDYIAFRLDLKDTRSGRIYQVVCPLSFIFYFFRFVCVICEYILLIFIFAGANCAKSYIVSAFIVSALFPF